MATNNINSALYTTSSTKRLTGLVSGLDTDALVKQMILAQQNRLDKANQKKQLAEWKRESYLSVISTINSFQSKHLDVLNPTSIMRASSFKTTTASVPSGMEKYVSVSSTSDAVPGSLKIDEITQLATSQTITSKNSLSSSKPMSMSINLDTIKAALNSGNDAAMKLSGNISVTLDGITKTISLSNSNIDISNYNNINTGENYVVDDKGQAIKFNNSRVYYDNINDPDTFYTKDENGDKIRLMSDEYDSIFEPNETIKGVTISEFDYDSFFSDLTNDLNSQLLSAFGTKADGTAKLAFNHYEQKADSESTFNINLNVRQEGSQAKVSSVVLTNGITAASGQANYIDVTKSIGTLFPKSGGLTTNDGKVNFSVNGVKFEFESTATMKDIMNAVNASKAGVKMSYSTLTDKIVFTADETGAGNRIALEDLEGTNFLKTILGETSNSATDVKLGNNVEGKDAVLKINGQEIARSSNTFTIDGVNITLLATTPADFNTTQGIQVMGGVDTKQAIDNIKEFVESYNGLMSFLNGLVNEKKEKGYQPLTAEEKSELSEKQIEDLEKMAKSGILKSDQNILRIINELRSAMVTMTTSSNGGFSLSSAGIKLSDKRDGTMEIDEEKLKAALEKNPDALTKLFTQLSDIPKGEKLTSSNKKAYAEMYEKTMGKKLSVNPSTGEVNFTQKDLDALRFNTLGIGQRLSEIVSRATNPSPSKETRGSLIRIVGTDGKNALIDYESYIGTQIRTLNTSIDSLQQRLYDAEDRAYLKLSKLEKALSTLNSQSSSLFNQ